MKKSSVLMAAALLILVSTRSFAQGQEPDLIVVNGKIGTVDNAMTIVQAMAIRGDTILKTGTNAEIQAMAGPKTKTLDVKGKTVVPGFIDPHRNTGFSWGPRRATLAARSIIRSRPTLRTTSASSIWAGTSR